MQIDLPACVTCILGRSGSGKTTFALRYLLNVPAACRFVFDDRGQVAQRLRITPAGTLDEIEAAIPSRWVVFNPHRMFPGRLKEAFAWFCKFAFDASGRGPGKKVLFVDEVWQWCDPNRCPPELLTVVQTGRVYGLELLTVTQRPNRLNGALLDQATELVAFSLLGDNGLDRIAELGVTPEAVAALPKGQFIAFNLDSGATLSGRMW